MISLLTIIIHTLISINNLGRAISFPPEAAGSSGMNQELDQTGVKPHLQFSNSVRIMAVRIVAVTYPSELPPMVITMRPVVQVCHGDKMHRTMPLTLKCWALVSYEPQSVTFPPYRWKAMPQFCHTRSHGPKSTCKFPTPTLSILIQL